MENQIYDLGLIPFGSKTYYERLSAIPRGLSYGKLVSAKDDVLSYSIDTGVHLFTPNDDTQPPSIVFAGGNFQKKKLYEPIVNNVRSTLLLVKAPDVLSSDQVPPESSPVN